MNDRLTYSAVILSHALTESKNSHTPEVAIRVKTSKCLSTNEPVEKEFKVDLWITEKAADKTIKTLREIGFQGDSFDAMNSDELVGVEVEVCTEFEEYNGQSRERVRFMNKKGNFASRGFSKISEDKEKALKAKYTSMFKNVKKGSVPNKVTLEASKDPVKALSSLGATPVENGADDDLPFNWGHI